MDPINNIHTRSILVISTSKHYFRDHHLPCDGEEVDAENVSCAAYHSSSLDTVVVS